jgi:hypothetical protein
MKITNFTLTIVAKEMELDSYNSPIKAIGLNVTFKGDVDFTVEKDETEFAKPDLFPSSFHGYANCVRCIKYTKCIDILKNSPMVTVDMVPKCFNMVKPITWCDSCAVKDCNSVLKDETFTAQNTKPECWIQPNTTINWCVQCGVLKGCKIRPPADMCMEKRPGCHKPLERKY